MGEVAALGGILAVYLAILHGLPVAQTDPREPWLRLLLPNLWLLAATAAFAWWRPPALRWVRPGRRWRVGSVVIAAAGTLVLLGAALWPSPTGATLRLPTGPSFLLVLLVPVAEEAYFRGILLDRVRGLAGGVVAALGVSLLFALLHLPAGAHGPMFLVSLVLCVLTLYTGSVLWAALLHLGWNALAVVTALPVGTDRWTLALIAVMVMGTAAATAVWHRRRR